MNLLSRINKLVLGLPFVDTQYIGKEIEEVDMRGEAKKVYEEIRQDLIRIHANWQIFKQLFATEDGRHIVMNNTAQGFFRLMQDVLVDNAVISLSRLTDPAARYLSLARLVKLLRNQVPHTIFEELLDDLKAIEDSSNDIREHRHKRIAHKVRKDEPPELSDTSARLPPLTRKKIEGTMQQIAEFMNKIINNFESVEQIYDPIIKGDANSLVFFLEQGLQATR